MAQTVATQRGTVSANGRTTLFTQSGGNSTRVILNQVVWYIDSVSAISGVTAHLSHVSSSGPVSIIGFYNDSNRGYNLSYPSFQLMPNSNGTGPIQGGGYLGSGYTNGVIFSASGSGADWIGSRGANSISIGMNGNVYSYMPQNYWIGPGDSIAFTSSYSATVGYHFTTITES